MSSRNPEVPEPQRRAIPDSECLLLEGGDILFLQALLLASRSVKREKEKAAVVGCGTERRRKIESLDVPLFACSVPEHHRVYTVTAEMDNTNHFRATCKKDTKVRVFCEAIGAVERRGGCPLDHRRVRCPA